MCALPCIGPGKLLSKTKPISASMPKIVIPPSISTSLRFLRGLDGRFSFGRFMSLFLVGKRATLMGLGCSGATILIVCLTANQKGASWLWLKHPSRIVRRAWTTQDERELKKHSKSKAPVRAISRRMRRTPGALRQKARQLGFSIGHQPRRRTRRR